MSDHIQIEGYIIFVNFNKGSKSEHFAPVLVGSQGDIIPLENRKDNPFMHESFKPYHLKYCEVSGKYSDNAQTLIIDKITELSDPVFNFWEENNDEDDVTA